VGASKSGEFLNFIIAVDVSEDAIVKSVESAPEEIEKVANSETLRVATVVEVAMFSCTENVDPLVKVGLVKSGKVIVT
jgi:hypothetical protein